LQFIHSINLSLLVFPIGLPLETLVVGYALVELIKLPMKQAFGNAPTWVQKTVLVCAAIIGGGTALFFNYDLSVFLQSNLILGIKVGSLITVAFLAVYLQLCLEPFGKARSETSNSKSIGIKA
jgi:hypothetical protein